MCVCVCVFSSNVSWSWSWIYFCWIHASLPTFCAWCRCTVVESIGPKRKAEKKQLSLSLSLSLSHSLYLFLSLYPSLSLIFCSYNPSHYLSLSHVLFVYLSIYLSISLYIFFCFLASLQDHAHSFDTVKPCLTSHLWSMSRNKNKNIFLNIFSQLLWNLMWYPIIKYLDCQYNLN